MPIPATKTLLQLVRRRIQAMLQAEVIGKIFLIILAIILSLSMINTLQGSLSAIGAGNTRLAYAIARQSTNSQLKPFGRKDHYKMFSGTDTQLYNYFYLDHDSGSLIVRDGLRGFNMSANPLQIYPFRIEDLRSNKNSQNKESHNEHYLYLHLLNCQDYLKKKEEITKQNYSPRAADISEAESSNLCRSEDGVIMQETTAEKVAKWLQEKRSDSDTLPSTIDTYLEELNEVFFPQQESGKQQTEEMEPPNGQIELRKGKAPVKVREIFALQTKLDPGTVLYTPQSIAESIPKSIDKRAGKVESERPPPPPAATTAGQEEQLRQKETLILILILARIPALFVGGIVIPGLLYIMRHRYLIVQRCLKPYLLLLLAQVFTMSIANYMMGEGLAVWVGFLYTGFRTVQLVGCLDLARGFTRPIDQAIDYRKDRPRWLLPLLVFLLLLWGSNGLGLLVHILTVFKTISFISPS
jgi:hypothetical protein